VVEKPIDGDSMGNDAVLRESVFVSLAAAVAITILR